MEKFQDESLFESYVIIDGRKFISHGATYPFPSDEIEANRLNNRHFRIRWIWKENFAAPIKEKLAADKMTVLDIGCGTGAWIVDMAKEYPRSSFVGVDLINLFPGEEETKKNLLFLQMNVLDRLPFDDGSFDFVHQRDLMHAYTETQWQTIVIPEIARVTKSGGYCEFYEESDKWEDQGPIYENISNTFSCIMATKGVNSSIATRIEEFLKENGQFTDIKVLVERMPVGSYAGRIAELTLENTLNELAGLKPILKAPLGVTDQEFDNMIGELRKECDECKTWFKAYRY
ncbi:5087_t:CDS:2 [Ambispora leptoticha]|uniref:5087_t:CDS:1 n=1 Tax=Ambispora leptoticha TaxID=144679 RepID=A0A9N8V5F9_9GLOM|nr:5087_t:CDS:2 [Ambispora leptoticha]